MPTHAETARYLIDGDDRFMVITHDGGGRGSGIRIRNRYRRYSGKAHVDHTPFEDCLPDIAPERAHIWNGAKPTDNSWSFTIEPEFESPVDAGAKQIGWRVHAIVYSNGSEEYLPAVGDKAWYESLAQIRTGNTFFVAPHTRLVDTYEQVRTVIHDLDAARAAYNSSKPLELRECLVRLADGIPRPEYAEDHLIVDGLYTTGGITQVDMYVTFRTDGMTPKEAMTAVTAIT